MMNFPRVCLCLVLFAVAVGAQSPSPDPFECGVNAECDSMSSLDISFNGVGQCTGTANANCSALAESENCFKEVLNAVNQGTCTPDNITSAASCFGFAVAEVFATAYVAINCTGEASGCGFAQANANAWACTFAGLLVRQEVSVGGDPALCDLSVSPTAAAIASVATEVQVNICANGTEFREEFQQEFGQRIEQLVAEAMAGCIVMCTVDGPVASEAVSGNVALLPPQIEGNADVTMGGESPLPCDITDPVCRQRVSGDNVTMVTATDSATPSP